MVIPINTDFYQKKLAPESHEERIKLDKKKIIKAKKNNFSSPKYEIESYYSESNWLRSNGNFRYLLLKTILHEEDSPQPFASQ